MFSIHRLQQADVPKKEPNVCHSWLLHSLSSPWLTLYNYNSAPAAAAASSILRSYKAVFLKFPIFPHGKICYHTTRSVGHFEFEQLKHFITNYWAANGADCLDDRLETSQIGLHINGDELIIFWLKNVRLKVDWILIIWIVLSTSARSPLTRFWKNNFFPHPLVKLIRPIVGSLRDREVTCSASDRQDANAVSGQQSHLIHLTIINRFSCPSLACIFTKVA